ncbi:MAG: mevalonate kinase [Candidatus Hodarchaeota archaeon]
MEPFRVTAPGRICLFGEHSDYLGLDVIPAAIDLEIELLVNPRRDKIVMVQYTDLDQSDEFELDEILEYQHRRDYLRSAFNVLKRHGIHPAEGMDIKIEGSIPIAAGLSGSSALTTAAVLAVAHASGKTLDARELADLAFSAEVLEFGECGGMQDHHAIANGGIIHLDLGKNYKVTPLPAQLGKFVIGDSREKKEDTLGDLRMIKSVVEEEYSKLQSEIPSFNRRNTSVGQVAEVSGKKPDKARTMAEATLRNRDLTHRALELLRTKNPDPQELGRMIQEHHDILRDGLDRSTPKIERLIKAAIDAGALGCKINGSGGGGTMVAYAPNLEREVVHAIQKAGGITYVVGIRQGASISKFEQ